jgi:nitrate reductase gamma subunit
MHIGNRFWLGVLLVALGVAALLAAPLVQWCVVDGDASACETIGTIVLNVVGGVLIAVGGVVLVLGRGHKIAA